MSRVIARWFAACSGISINMLVRLCMLSCCVFVSIFVFVSVCVCVSVCASALVLSRGAGSLESHPAPWASTPLRERWG